MKRVPTKGKRLTPAEVERVRELRYMDGYSCEAVGEMVGCSSPTVSKYAPGYPSKVSNEPLRTAFLASPLTAADVARKIEWWDTRSNGRMNADGSRVKRALGLMDDFSGLRRRGRRTMIDAETAELIGEALGVERWELAA